MRFVVTLFLWLVTTALLAVAVPAAWAQKTLVDQNGYADFAASAARDPRLQEALAGELSAQAVTLAARNGTTLNGDLVRRVASVYTASSAFPGQFAQANRFAHRWLFTSTIASGVDDQGRWVIDLAPMLSDRAFTETLSSLNIEVPTTVPVPLTENAPAVLRPGQLQKLATWGPWATVAAAVLTGVFALLTLAAARRRGKALAALGVSALLVGAAGWAGLEVGRRYVDRALNATSGDVRQAADVMVGQAIAGMHQWLNITLAAGGGLVVVGVVAALLGGLRRRPAR